MWVRTDRGIGNQVEPAELVGPLIAVWFVSAGREPELPPVLWFCRRTAPRPLSTFED